MITISNLKKQYGETVACNIQEFTINSGEILGLVGNNGAGKTTLFRLMLDLIKYQSCKERRMENLYRSIYRRRIPHRFSHTGGIFHVHCENPSNR